MCLKERISIPGLILLIFCSLFPLAFLCLGIILILSDMLINFSLVLTHFLLPLATMAGLVLVFLFGKKRFTKVFCAITILLLFFFFAHVCAFLGKFETLSIYTGNQVYDTYQSDSPYRNNVYPLTEIGNPQQIHYFDYEYDQGIVFGSEADTLICQYTADEYQSQIAFIEENYEFETDPLTAVGYSCSPTFKIEGFSFRTILTNGYYPKDMIFIATNDQSREIVYMSFYNDDLNYITNLPQFILDECGWKHIR